MHQHKKNPHILQEISTNILTKIYDITVRIEHAQKNVNKKNSDPKRPGRGILKLKTEKS